MTAFDVERLTQLNGLLDSDLFHLIRKNEFGSLLSYKAKNISLSSVFSTYAELDELNRKIETLSNSFNSLFSKFATKNEVEQKYVSKETLSNVTPSLLTYSNMEELTSHYVTSEKANAKAAEARQDANRLADEMTDFLGAAIVGIRQSGAGESEPEPTPEEGE